MQERKNIWGKTGCELPNGNLCTACCVLPQVELESFYVSLIKPANSPCPHLVDKGCGLHNTGKPSACGWHCSMANKLGKVDLIAQALSQGSVTQTEASLAAFELMRTSMTGVELSEFIKSRVLDRSMYLRRVTYPKVLIERDLDET